jgi:hypothetical protein
MSDENKTELLKLCTHVTRYSEYIEDRLIAKRTWYIEQMVTLHLQPISVRMLLFMGKLRHVI